MVAAALDPEPGWVVSYAHHIMLVHFYSLCVDPCVYSHLSLTFVSLFKIYAPVMLINFIDMVDVHNVST